MGAWGYRLVAFTLLGLTTVAVLVRVLTSTGCHAALGVTTATTPRRRAR